MVAPSASSLTDPLPVFDRSSASSAHTEDNRGQGMVEYALILVLIAVVVIVIMQVVGHQVTNVFSNVSNALGKLRLRGAKSNGDTRGASGSSLRYFVGFDGLSRTSRHGLQRRGLGSAPVARSHSAALCNSLKNNRRHQARPSSYCATNRTDMRDRLAGKPLHGLSERTCRWPSGSVSSA